MSILDYSVKDCKCRLSAQFIHLDSIGQHSAVHDVLLTSQLHVPLLQPDGGGVVSLNHLLQRGGQLLPALFGVLPQFLDGRDDHGVLNRGVNVDNLLSFGSFLQLADPGLQAIVLEACSIS